MSERRYSDDEVADIFARATEARRDALRSGRTSEGLTLAELQDIGREVGIEPDAVARAARALDRPAPPRAAGPLGLPLRVGHAVELGRRMSDAEWERLVVDLRHTFDATGRVRSEGTFRQWTNGNLHVLVEPGEHGDRVRFRTMKGSAKSLMVAGAVMFAVSALILVTGLLGSSDRAEALADAAVTALVGAGLVAGAAVSLPSWARLRKSQMEEVGARLSR